MTTQTSKTPAFKMNNGMLAFVSAQRNKVVKTAPKRKECPKCNRDRHVSMFGVRTHRNPVTGKPERFSLQSYCVDCRAGNVKKSKPAPKKAPKAAPETTQETAPVAPVTEAPAQAPAPVAPIEAPAPVKQNGKKRKLFVVEQ